MLRINQAAFAQNRRAFERVVQLPHIAGPVVSEEHLSGIRREARGRPSEGLANVLQERLAQRENVGAARAVWGCVRAPRLVGAQVWGGGLRGPSAVGPGGGRPKDLPLSCKNALLRGKMGGGRPGGGEIWMSKPCGRKKRSSRKVPRSTAA